MKYLLLAQWIVVSLTFCANKTFGHGTPINVFVQSATNQLAVFEGYEPGELESLGGSDIFTDAPGIGISSLVNGLGIGDTLHLNVVQGLLYWDGTDLASTAETLVIDWPDSGGTSTVEAYEVSAESGYQIGMTWGTYSPPGGNGGWDAHGDYSLESANSAPGIYGLILQLASHGYVNSEPFLLPLVYDPSSSFGVIEIAAGIADLEQAMLPLPTADFDRDTVVDQTDLAVWKKGYGHSSTASQVQGDATDDGAINGHDFLAWQLQFSGDAPIPKLLSPSQIPEPTSIAIAAMLGTLLCVFRISAYQLR